MNLRRKSYLNWVNYQNIFFFKDLVNADLHYCKNICICHLVDLREFKCFRYKEILTKVLEKTLYLVEIGGRFECYVISLYDELKVYKVKGTTQCLQNESCGHWLFTYTLMKCKINKVKDFFKIYFLQFI